MKKLFYLLIFLLFAGIAKAINIPFTDVNFKNKLLSSTATNNIAKDINGNSLKIDADSNNQISDTEALAVYQLNTSSASPSIVSIEGILYFTNLTVLDCQGNSIVNVNLSGLTNLVNLTLKNNTLTSLNLDGCSSLTTLDLKGNGNLTTLDFSTLTALLTTDISNCALTSVDISQCFHVTNIDVSSNNLVSIFAKNGSNEAIVLNGGSNNNLAYICVDESQLVAVQASVSSLLNCEVNSNCTFPPGGNYNKLIGHAIFDATGNGIDASDIPQNNLKLDCVFGTNSIEGVTDALGNYQINTVNTGNFTISPRVDNPTWFAVNPSNGNFPTSTNNISNNDFAIVPIGSHHDVEIMVMPIVPAETGQQAIYEVVYRNKGNQTHSGQVNVSYNSLLLGFLSSNVPLISATGLLTQNYTDLKPFESRSFRVTLNVSPLALLNTILNFNATIDATGESTTTQSDNSSSYSQKVTTTNNPNRITCLEGNTVDASKIGDYLHYQINFENTGTQTARNVVVKQVINTSKFDYTTLQVMNTSHPMQMKSNNNNFTYFFNEANLGGPGGQGGVLLKIKTNSSLQAGDSVSQIASIYFDYAPAINTNNEVTTFQNLQVDENQVDKSISIYPNPSSSMININSNNVINTVQLFDVQGRLLQTDLDNDINVTMDISQRENGVYFIKITSDVGIKVERIVKN